MKIEILLRTLSLRPSFLLTLLLTLALATDSKGFAGDKLVIYPAPLNEPASKLYQVFANGKKVPVYIAKIGAADNNRRFKAVDDLLRSAEYYDEAAFSYFDMQGTVKVTVAYKEPIKTIKILPARLATNVSLQKGVASFNVKEPGQLTIEVNGEFVQSLHLFVNPLDKNIPKPNDKNVIFYGPGIHELSAQVIGDNKTVYIAGGAVIRSVIGPKEQFGIEPSGLKNYAPRFLLMGNHIKLRGRGIIDAGSCPVHAGNFVALKGRDITVEGVIIRNSCGWTLPLRGCDSVVVNNVKILGYRANSDGIDICNSSHVTIRNCFIRTNDDLIVVKTMANEGPANNILVEKCVLWNQLAHALSIGAEIREPISNVKFINCDVIHDQGREWTLRIFHSDAAVVKNVSFKNIRVLESHQFISLWMGKMASSTEQGFGQIRDVIFSDISARGAPLTIGLKSADEVHKIKNVSFHQIYLNGKPLRLDQIWQSQFVENVVVN